MLVLLHTLWRKTLNSVLFGIFLMVLVGAYIAIGSGLPRVREAFEMNELQFFSAWPIKLLMGLLVINLATVTWTRIPFTPPRYGVWMIHTGIIILIAGMSFYYNRKVEGLTRLYTDPRIGAQAVDYYYDNFERSIYIRRGDGQLWTLCRLTALPRFKNHETLDDSRLRNIKPMLLVSKGFGQPASERPLFDQDVRIDITGYWPYANITTKYYPDATQMGGVPGIHLTLADQSGSDAEAWLISSDMRNNVIPIENNELQHLHMPQVSAIATLKEASTQIHKIKARFGGHEIPLTVEVGKTYPIEGTGYTITVESYNPAWPMSGTGEIVKALTLMVKSPAGGAEFRRMILDGKDLQTDFKLDDPTGGPMGKRQKEPLDKDLVLLYHYSDPFRLLPRQGSVKHLLVTANDSKSIAIISTGLSQASSFKELPDGVGEIELPAAEINAPFLKAMGQLPKSDQGHPPIKLKLERNDHVLRDDSVDVVPPAKRDRNFGESGAFQVVRAKVRAGDWSQDVLIPFAMDAAEAEWDGGVVDLPDGTHMQLQLGNTRLQLPAKLTLRKFDMVPYPGGDTGDMIRDFRSTVTITDPASGEESTAVAHMNSPIYFGDGAWLFFQAQFDPKSRWTVLGVGNRPGVGLMILGCVLMVVGLMWAFYLKPIIIRRMKEKALAEAAAKKKVPKQSEQELVASK